MVMAGTALALVVVALLVSTGVGVWFSRGQVGTVEDLITARNSADERRLTATTKAYIAVPYLAWAYSVSVWPSGISSRIRGPTFA